MGTRRRLKVWLTALVMGPMLAVAGAAAPAAAGVPQFPHPLRIDSRLFPLVAGTSFVYDGTIADDDGVHQHRVAFTVTDMVKRINGVAARVVWDRDFVDGELTEAELAFFAQDRRGDVYTLGEYPEEYEDGGFTGAPDTWVAGEGKAQGGILVPGHPQVGQRFVQGRAPSIEFYDAGLVKRRYTPACSAHHCYRYTLLVEESSPLAPEDGKQTKYYAPGVGLIKVGAEGGDSRESMRLSMIRYPRAAERSHIRAAVLRMERRAYRVSAVYRQTPPMSLCICRHN